jgi:hypothetical protein
MKKRVAVDHCIRSVQIPDSPIKLRSREAYYRTIVIHFWLVFSKTDAEV